jgi:hypothetical protein
MFDFANISENILILIFTVLLMLVFEIAFSLDELGADLEMVVDHILILSEMIWTL